MRKRYFYSALAILVMAVAGCQQAGGGAGAPDSGAAEKKEFSAATSEPKGTLKVSVEGQAVAASFEADGKTYAGTSELAQDGSTTVDLASQADTANKYRFTGTYDATKKSFTKTQFGKEGALKDIAFGSADRGKLHSFYTGTIQGVGLEEYNVTITVKSETSAAVLFSRKIGGQVDFHKDQPVKQETVYTETQGTISGHELTAPVRLEGEDFTFKTILHSDGYLRETQLIGQRGFTGERNPTLIYEYEMKGVDHTVSASGKKNKKDRNIAARFTGDLTITIHLSMNAYRNMNDKALKAKSNDVLKIGQIFVSFVDLTEKTEGTRRYKMYREGFYMTLFNILDRRSQVMDYDPTNLSAEEKKKWGENLGGIDSGRVPTAFVFYCPKDWFDIAKQGLKESSGKENAGGKPVTFKFGRAQSYNKFLDNGAVAEISASMLKRIK